MKTTIKCEICLKLFDVFHKKRKQKTCSKKCAYDLRKISKSQFYDGITKSCKICGNDFVDYTKKKTCSKCKLCIKKQSVETRYKNCSYQRTKEQNEKLSKTLKNKYKNGWNPNTEEVKKFLSENLKKRWLSGEMSAKTKKTCLEKYGVSHWTKIRKHYEMTEASKINKSVFAILNRETKPRKKLSDDCILKMRISAQKRIAEGKTLHSRGNGGFRKDLQHYVRSNWEANFARILNYNNVKYEYEKHFFVFPNGSTYTPDFLIDDTFFEIKGYWTNVAKQKFELMKIHYPHINVTIIDGVAYESLAKIYRKNVEWEGK
jgi:hypothetical protein